MVEVQKLPSFTVKSAIEEGVGRGSEGTSRQEGQSKTDFLLNTHNLVLESKQFNFEYCRIPVNDCLNMSFLRHMLHDYKDFQVCDLLEFGFPLGCSEEIKNLKSNFKVKNHKGAREFTAAIESYLESEIRQGNVLGPFTDNPFKTQFFCLP